MPPVTRHGQVNGSPHSSRLPVATRANQPRRKSAVAAQRRQEESWEEVRLSATNGFTNHQDVAHDHVDDDDAMEIDDDAAAAPPEEANVYHPLKEMAERVGRQVEEFAEQLDTWRASNDADQDQKRQAASSMVREFKSIAEKTVAKLTKDYGAQQQRAFEKNWTPMKTSPDGTAAEKGTTDNDEEEEEQDSTEARAHPTVDDLREWQEELHTWQLLHGLLECRYPDHTTYSAKEHASRLADMESNHRFSGDGTTWTDFLVNDGSARDKLTILKWLESTADLDESFGGELEMIEEQLEEGTIKGKSLFTSGWSDTKELIKAEKRLRLWDAPIGSGEPEIRTRDQAERIVTQLDMDAVTRQRHHVDTADRQFESSFWHMCWLMLRRGVSMDELREWCMDRNEFARAFSLGACISAERAPQNAQMRLRWRRMCRHLAKAGGVTSKERCVYALLAGDRTTIEGIGGDWNDFLFASINSLLLGQYESYVLQHYATGIPEQFQQSIRNSINTPVEEDAVATARSIISSLELHDKSKLSDDDSFKHIQASIIADDMDRFILQQGIELAHEARSQNYHQFNELINLDVADLATEEDDLPSIIGHHNPLRVMAHLYIICQQLGLGFGDEQQTIAAENVLCSYISFLRLSGKMALIPLYASHLSEKRRNDAMGRVISDIVDSQLRIQTMNLMKTSGVDVVDVLITQYESAMAFAQIGDRNEEFTRLSLCKGTPEVMFPGRRIRSHKPQKLTEDESLLIHSLEWFLLLERHWGMSFAALTEVAARFLAAGCVDAAIALYHTMSFDSVSKSLTQHAIGRRVNLMEDDLDNVDGTASHHLRNSSRRRLSIKPEITQLPADAQRQKIHHDILKVHARPYYELGQLVTALQALWYWREAEDDVVNATSAQGDISSARHEAQAALDEVVATMSPLLNDFLNHCETEETLVLLKKIRTAYLPDMILGYISALHAAGRLLSREHLVQCMDVATEIAANETLIETFKESGLIKDLIDAFARTSKTMLELNQMGPLKKRKGKAANKNLGIWDIRT